MGYDARESATPWLRRAWPEGRSRNGKRDAEGNASTVPRYYWGTGIPLWVASSMEEIAPPCPVAPALQKMGSYLKKKRGYVPPVPSV
ncbi:MAG: hypothetical protein NTAFB09_25380 [Nitrosospira sp.]